VAPWKSRLLALIKIIGLLTFAHVFTIALSWVYAHPTRVSVVAWSFAIISTLIGVVEFWWHVYPTLKDTLDKPLMRLLLLAVSWLAGLMSYIQARGWIMLLTEVDPNNFPRALIAFAGLIFVPFWLLIATGVGVISVPVYLGIVSVIEHIWFQGQFFRVLFGKATQPKPQLLSLEPGRGWRWFFGILGLFSLSGLLWNAASRPPFESVFRILGSALLVMTDFSYDKTCDVSSQTRAVAPLKDRRDLETAKVMIADIQSWTNIQFVIGQCK
jgi:hypothetical protein